MKLHELNPHIRYARIQNTSLADKHTVRVCYDARLFFFENATGSVRIGKTTYKIGNNTTIYGRKLYINISITRLRCTIVSRCVAKTQRSNATNQKK